MSYRQSNYDPNWGWEQAGPPVRPFNWVQWLGVAFGVLGIALYAAYFAGRAGWMPELLDSPTLGFPLFAAAIVLINSRRHPAHDPAPELAAARKRWLIVIALICAVVLGAAAVIEFSGAN